MKLRRLVPLCIISALLLQPAASCASAVAEVSRLFRDAGTNKIILSVVDGNPHNMLATVELLNGAMRSGPVTHWPQATRSYTSMSPLPDWILELYAFDWVALGPVATALPMDGTFPVFEFAIPRFVMRHFLHAWAWTLAEQVVNGAWSLPAPRAGLRYMWWRNGPMSSIKPLCLDPDCRFLQRHQLSAFLEDQDFGVATMDVVHAEYRLSDGEWISSGGQAGRGYPTNPSSIDWDEAEFNATTGAFEKLLDAGAVVLARLNTTLQTSRSVQWAACYLGLLPVDRLHVPLTRGVGVEFIYPRSMTPQLKQHLSGRSDLSGVDQRSGDDLGYLLRHLCERQSVLEP